MPDLLLAAVAVLLVVYLGFHIHFAAKRNLEDRDKLSDFLRNEAKYLHREGWIPEAKMKESLEEAEK